MGSILRPLAAGLLSWGLAAALWAKAPAPQSAARVVEITPHNFKSEVLGSKLPVLADVGAVWCVPCRQLAPLVDQMAKDYAGRLKVVHLDADTDGDLLEDLKVQAFPTLLFFKKGKVVHREEGLETEKALRAQIERILGPAAP